MRYPGGKNADGTYQWIINQIPPHDVFIEPFAGSAAIARLKRPAKETVLIDLDPGALAALGGAISADVKLIEGCGIDWLYLYATQADPTWFVYLDPPYLQSAVKTKLRYKHVLDVRQHERLLDIAKKLNCSVMLSGYASELYTRTLKGWRMATKRVITRGATMATECLWMNYPAPKILHDVAFVGETWREREKLRRQQKRWANRFRKMTPLQQQAVRLALEEATRS